MARPADPARPAPGQPLADRLRPRRLDEVAGQRHLLAPGRPLREALQSGHLHSMVLWGPPGSGKTTLARLIAGAAEARFLSLSAVLSGVKDIRAAIDQARAERAATGRATLLFVDEVPRFNKAQQDAFLPHIEAGTVTFIGATTENPSFELNNALLSRVRTYVLQPLTAADIEAVLRRAIDVLAREDGLQVTLTPEAAGRMAAFADGDARRALNLLELAIDLGRDDAGRVHIDGEALAPLLTEGGRRFDKGGDAFYDQISALHKSVRGSDPDGALYWLCRMLDGGADPRYLARRLVRMASEDIGNADPRALQLSLDAAAAYERLGSPEGELALAQAAVYLAVAPKSNAVYRAFTEVMAEVRRGGSLPVPTHLRNAPTRLLRELGHGKGYRYAHDEPDAYAAGEQYLPDALHGRRWYHPVDRGLEARIRDKLAALRARDAAAQGRDGEAD